MVLKEEELKKEIEPIVTIDNSIVQEWIREAELKGFLAGQLASTKDEIRFLKNLQIIQKQDRIDSIEFEIQLKDRIDKLNNQTEQNSDKEVVALYSKSEGSPKKEELTKKVTEGKG